MISQPLHGDSPSAPSGSKMPRQAIASQPASRDEQREKKSGRWVSVGVLLFTVILVVSSVAATLPRLQQEKRLIVAAITATHSAPQVTVAPARSEPGVSEQELPGNSQANREAALYPRTNGYLKQWFVDIGDRVEQGQLLAEISAPDVDAQLARAQAELQQAKANLLKAKADDVYATTEERRYRRLLPNQTITGEEYERKFEDYGVAKAVVVAMEAAIKLNEATVQRLTVLQGFQKIVAPFPGVITNRNVDPGSLVTADNPSATRELFHLMQTDPLRVFVDVPQTFSTSIKVGQDADVYRPEDPSKLFHGKVTRTANALDPATRTLLIQVDVPNPDEALRPGMYLQVKFAAVRSVPAILIPSAALVIRADGQVQAALLGAGNTVQYREVQLGRDHGTEVEVTTGLAGGETVIVHPGDALAEGQEVKPVSQKE